MRRLRARAAIGWLLVLAAGLHATSMPARAYPVRYIARTSRDRRSASPSSTAWVDSLYRALFGRDPDPEGLEFWASEVDRTGDHLGTAVRVAASNEGRLHNVDDLYRAYLGRPADPDGAAFWSRWIDDHSTWDAAARIVGSAESWWQSQGAPGAWVARLYELTLGREPDSGGFKFWVSQLGSGAPLPGVAIGFTSSAEIGRRIVTAAFTQLTGAQPADDDPALRSASDLWRLSGGNAQMVVAAVFASPAVIANPPVSPQQPTLPPAAAQRSPSVNGRLLTSDGGDYFIAERSDASLSVRAAPTNSSGNTREVWWPVEEAATVDQQVCVTWASETGGLSQEGIVLRARPTPDGTFRAVTVTKNVWFGGVWYLNVHAWDTGQQPPFQLIRTIDMSGVLRPGGVVAPLPWRVCARARGSELDVKAWLPTEAEPSWGDSTHGGSATLPGDQVASGMAGWYTGHIPPGGSELFTDFTSSAP